MGHRPREPRMSWDALVAVTMAVAGCARMQDQHDDPWDPLVMSFTRMGQVLGFDPQTLKRWKRDGVPLSSADRVAVRLGRHPAEIWVEFYEGAA